MTQQEQKRREREKAKKEAEEKESNRPIMTDEEAMLITVICSI